MKTKILSLTLIFTMVISILGSVGVVAAFTDIPETSELYQATNFLDMLGLMTGFPDGAFHPDISMTRAEFVATLIRVHGLSNITPPTHTGFSDVPINHWASGYIATADGLGLLEGLFTDLQFQPDTYVTYQHAIVMIMRMLEHTPVANFYGGFPNGYILAAGRPGTDVVKGIFEVITEWVYGYCGCCGNFPVESHEPVEVIIPNHDASRGNIARLLFNAIQAPMMIPIAWFPGGERQYIIADGRDGRPFEIPLWRFHGISKIQGTVVAVHDSTIDVQLWAGYDVGWSWGDVNFRYQVDDIVTFRIGDTNVSELLGKNVLMFAQEEGEEIYDIILSISEVPLSILNIEQYFDDVIEVHLSFRGTTGYMFIASYSGGRFLGLSEPQAINEGWGTVYFFSIEEIHQDADRVRVFIWDRFDTMTPFAISRGAQRSGRGMWRMI